MKETSTSNKTEEQTLKDGVVEEQGDTSQESSEDLMESSVDGDETSDQEQKPEDKNGSVDDYVDNPADNLAKRYADSSREGHRLAQITKEQEARIKQLEEELENYKSQPNISSDTEERLKKLEERYASEEREKIIQKFESNNPVTPEMRSVMKPIVTELVKDKGISLADALEVAYNRISKEPRFAEKIREEGKLEAFAQSRYLDQASYTEAGKVAKAPLKEDLPILTRAEREMAVKMGAVDANGNVTKSFLKHLKAVRENK